MTIPAMTNIIRTAQSIPGGQFRLVQVTSGIKVRSGQVRSGQVRSGLTSTDREVYLGLESEDGEGEGDPGGDADTDQDGVLAVEGGEGAKHQTLADGEDEEENEVDGRFPPDALTAHHGEEADHHHTHRHPHEPTVLQHEPEQNISVPMFP